MKRKTNFDIYLEEQLKDKDFAARFKKAGEAWDVALQLAAYAKSPDFLWKSWLESPSYEGHSLSTLRRVAEVLGATFMWKFNAKSIRNKPVSGRLPKPNPIMGQRLNFAVRKATKIPMIMFNHVNVDKSYSGHR
jgi:hypothetical protein